MTLKFEDIEKARCGLLQWTDGKYTVVFDEISGKLKAYRHGKEWQDLTGNNLVLSMLFDLAGYRHED